MSRVTAALRNSTRVCSIEVGPTVAVSPPQDMMQLKLELQEMLLAREEQEEVLRKRERELTALKGALKEEVAAHDQEVDKMKEQYEKEISRLQASLEEAKQVLLRFLPSSVHPSCLRSPCSLPSPSPDTPQPLLSEGCGDKRPHQGRGLHATPAVGPYVLHQTLCYCCSPRAAGFTSHLSVSSGGLVRFPAHAVSEMTHEIRVILRSCVWAEQTDALEQENETVICERLILN